MEVSKNAWHYKILSQQQKNNLRHNPTLCDYFWKVVIAALGWVVVACVGVVFIGIALFIIYQVGYIYFFIVFDYFGYTAFDGNTIHTSLITNIAIVFLWFLSILFRLGKKACEKGRYIKHTRQPTLIELYIKAKKQRYCPIIQFKD